MFSSVLLALLVAFPSQEPELLPSIPDGWRFERLDLPLEFAPELDHAGFEELAFAPGMFDPEAASYFSYALCVRVEEDLAVDRAFVQRFLEAYYLGLCRAVGESRGLDLDLSGFAVSLEERGSGYTAVVDMVDAFVTGRELCLLIELTVHPGPGYVELFGLASPSASGAPIWNELGRIRADWRAARPLPVFLNHLYFVPDAETYAAIRDSEFLRGLCVSEERETVRSDITYRGVYFYGRETYFEFLAPDPGSGFAVGSTGLAFGSEVVGGNEDMAARLQEAGVATAARPVTRSSEGEQVPWFSMLGVESVPGSHLSLFSLEYEREFLARWFPGPSPAEDGITRAAVLGRYAAQLDQLELAREGLLEDVREVRLALEESERAHFLTVCAALGFEVEGHADQWICTGPRIRFVVRSADTPGGITAIVLGLEREVEHDPVLLGSLELRFEGRTAILSAR